MQRSVIITETLLHAALNVLRDQIPEPCQTAQIWLLGRVHRVGVVGVLKEVLVVAIWHRGLGDDRRRSVRIIS